MKSLTDLWQLALDELGAWCCVGTTQDRNTALRRFEHEGLSFFTISLADFAKDFQKSLEAGSVAPDMFPGFARHAELPKFLGGFLERVFDRKSGRLLDYPCIDSVFSIRQLCMLLGKTELPCSDERVEAAMSGYLECEHEVRLFDEAFAKSHLLKGEFDSVVRSLYTDAFTDVDFKIHNGEVIPKHGPGVTADRLLGNEKYDQSEWPERMESFFPYGEYSIPSWRHNHLLDAVHFIEPGAERPVRVISVPKTLKTPRIIAVEPTAMQYMQQAISEILVETLVSDSTIGSMIGFDDQPVNRELAMHGSIDKSLATLDLSEASDRVSNQLVRRMVHRFPSFGEGLDVTRSRKADVPGRGIIRLSKFASMGSALCFPIEATVFLAVVFVGISRELNRPLDRRTIRSFHGRVRVYGDDIIVPVEYAESVIGALEDFGLKVNTGKSFLYGSFRESCGGDYYDGVDVTPVRVRRNLPTSRADVEEIISTVALRNLLYHRGLWKTAGGLDDLLGRLIPYPAVGPESPVLGKVSYLGYDTQRTSPHLHRPEVKGMVQASIIPESKISGEGALLKFFLKRGLEPFADKEHLERQGRPVAVSIKHRWASSY